MEEADLAFFYAARSVGITNVVRWIVESPFLETWDARIMYFTAKMEERQLRLYEMDLLWLDVKRHYEDLPRPSEAANRKKDNRTAEEIRQEILRKFRE